jgi:hypothetical protein
MNQTALSWLEQEARALLTRLERVRSFALLETMVPAAMPSGPTMMAIEHYLAAGRRSLHHLVWSFIHWLRQHPDVAPSKAQRRFTFLRLRFNAVLTQFDIFADAVTQRSEHNTGVWLAGLDVVAKDSLQQPGAPYQAPPLICYVDRGHGAAIRRARTRLPGGGENPVAVIRVPRERMVGSGIASSLVHEVGHQGAALLELIPSLRPLLKGFQTEGQNPLAWQCWDRWISEIIADFWSVGTLGISSTQGLIGVMSLPPVFVFRFTLEDPHPFPWIRVKLSLQMGHALYPDPQWGALEQLWESLYPRANLKPEMQQLLATLEAGILSFVNLLVHHRPPSLHGRSLRELFARPERHPTSLRSLYRAVLAQQTNPYAHPPALVFAAIGQARADDQISPEAESKLLGQMLTEWALRSMLTRGSPSRLLTLAR